MCAKKVGGVAKRTRTRARELAALHSFKHAFAEEAYTPQPGKRAQRSSSSRGAAPKATPVKQESKRGPDASATIKPTMSSTSTAKRAASKPAASLAAAAQKAPSVTITPMSKGKAK